MTISRRGLIAGAAALAAGLLPAGALARLSAMADDPDHTRLKEWTGALRAEGLCRSAAPLGRAATRVGELAAGTPYEAHTLEAYLARGSAAVEPLTLSLTRFDCVTLVESCLAVARAASEPAATAWERFGREVGRMRYREASVRDTRRGCTTSASGSPTASGAGSFAISAVSSGVWRMRGRSAS